MINMLKKEKALEELKNGSKLVFQYMSGTVFVVKNKEPIGRVRFDTFEKLTAEDNKFGIKKVKSGDYGVMNPTFAMTDQSKN